MKKENGIGIIALTIIVVIIISAGLYLFEKNKPQPQQEQTDSRDTKIYKVSKEDENYNDVKAIVEDYIATIIKKDGKKLTNILRPLYKKQFRVVEETVAEDLYTKLNLYGNEAEVQINEVYMYKNSDNMRVYFVFGKVKNKTSNELTDLKVMVELNSKTRHYTITPNDGVVKLGFDNINEKSLMDITNMIIEENEFNVY